ncbi:MAG: CHAT domain-containing protein [Cyanobacteria bacterium J06633_8]
MNSQRQDAYLNLIRQLLDCPVGEESEILAARRSLIDAEFLQVVEAVAKMMWKQGNRDTANWLKILANELAEALNINVESSSQTQVEELSEEDLQAYLQVLMEILRVISESNGDAQVVYPLFAANTDKLDDVFAAILRRWAINNFKQVEADVAEYIALNIGDFGNLIQQFPLGNKANNIEIAIASYETVLKVFTQQAFPQKWAAAQNNLAAAYSDRIKGDKAFNIENAISCYKAALQVVTQQALPQQWAAAQNNLGNAYRNRIKGDIASNIENAISSFQAALQVLTQQAFPQQWAMTQNNLANAYSDRIKGDKASNIENAISCFQAALQVVTQQAFPYEWAMTQHNLGNAYSNRIKGDKASNIENAISCYNGALQVRIQQAFPLDWAQTQNNLAAAYRIRIKGDKASNIELAISAYNAALQVVTQQAFPQDWAMTQNNLGLAYWSRIKGDIASNIENAIFCYSAALQIYTQEAFPQQNAATLENLGILYQDEGRFNAAYNTYESAIATVELLRGEIISGEESKRKQAEEWNKLYRNMVEVCLQLGEETLALEYIERSKTRNLVELLFNDELYPKGEIPTNVTQQLQQLRKQIAAEKQSLEQAEQNSLDINRNHLNQLRQQREDLISKIIGFKPIRFSEIQSLVDENTAIVEWYIFNDCFRAFIITRDCKKPIIWHSSKEDFDKLVDWSFDEYLDSYYENKKRWRYELNHKLQQLAEILHLDEVISLIPQSCKKLVLIPHRYLHLLPIHALQLSDGEYLIDKFTDGVSYAPSCQLLQVSQQQLSKCRNAVCRDAKFRVSTLLFAIQNPTNDLEYSDIEVETIATKFQSNYILKHDKATLTAFQQQSNNGNFKNAHWLHFSSHGYFNLNNPYKSALQLHGAAKFSTSNATESSRILRTSEQEAIELEKCLTLENIFELTLSNCRLVTLSACESGYTDFNNTSDEYIGLPSGFIHAGAASIVSTLWAVDDFSTAILTIKFYENIQNSTSTNNIALALNQAQNWFRQITIEQLRQWIDENKNMTADNKLKIKQRLAEYNNPQEKPFEKPYYWAGFYAVGD